MKKTNDKTLKNEEEKAASKCKRKGYELYGIKHIKFLRKEIKKTLNKIEKEKREDYLAAWKINYEQLASTDEVGLIVSNISITISLLMLNLDEIGKLLIFILGVICCMIILIVFKYRNRFKFVLTVLESIGDNE